MLCYVTRKGRDGSLWALSATPAKLRVPLACGLQTRSVSPGQEGLGSGLPRELPAGPRATGRPVCDSGRRAKHGRCLQGFPSGLRRLLHRLHEEAPVWGCPGADRSL